MKVAVSGVHRNTYHTEKCRNYPENPRMVAREKLADFYTECKWCSDSVGHERQTRTCPFCGENTRKLPDHLVKCNG